MLAQLFTLALLSAPTLGKKAPKLGAQNLTVAFFSDANAPLCDKADTSKPDTSKALIFTTNTIPSHFTCFNTSDIFSQSNTTGITYATPEGDDDDDLGLPNYVEWQVQNLEDYDSVANYSHVWYEQNSVSGQIDEGVDGRWVLYFYSFGDCRQYGTPLLEYKDTPLEENPWFTTSCQTKEGGQCRVVPKTIKSFALLRAKSYNELRKGCQKWALLGSAAPAQRQWSMGLVGAVVVSATVILLL